MLKSRQLHAHIFQNEIFLVPKVSEMNMIFMSIANYERNHSYPHKAMSSKLLQLLLVMSGSAELKPGPHSPKYPCGEC